MGKTDLRQFLQTQTWILEDAVAEEFERWPAGLECLRVMGTKVEAARPEPRSSAAHGFGNAKPNTVIEFLSEPLALEFALQAGEVFGIPVYGLTH
jgi:hypothetical protein